MKFTLLQLVGAGSILVALMTVGAIMVMRGERLVTVCEEARCPNLGECWSKGTATFMIMGDTCTRSCRFCAVKTGRGEPLDPDEPRRVADAVAKLGLRHVVITSVDRDDLRDGGAAHFAAVIRAIRTSAPGTTVEVLTPDFLRKPGGTEVVADARPDVFNHNLETVPRLYPSIRPGARYYQSLRVLDRVKAVPEFRGAVPALAFAKGIARTAGERLVWDLTYRDGRMLVNDVDLSAMAGGGRR